MQRALNFIIFRKGVLTGEMVFDKLLHLSSKDQSYRVLPIWRYGAVYADRTLCPASLLKRAYRLLSCDSNRANQMAQF